jgi:hypothetical protein
MPTYQMPVKYQIAGAQPRNDIGVVNSEYQLDPWQDHPA